ncbi:hypothetical protein [Streptomyces sp. NPDC059928]|uniref:hypothetical protein n=2 Tax=Streptomyces TaxID=1883 RepID=UPI00365AA8BF
MSHRISTMFTLSIAGLLAVTGAASPAAAAGVAHGDFLYTTAHGLQIGLRNVPTDRCNVLVRDGATNGTNATDKTAHIYATSDCHQQVAVAAPGNPGRGTAWNTPGFEPTAHSVWFECDRPSVC